MKIVSFVLLFFLGSFAGMAQERPDWVKQRPVNSMYYTGIARVEKSEKDYMEKAKAKALRDLVSEIKVVVASNSLLKTMEENGVVRSDYEETIRVEAGESIEKYEVIDSWQNDTEYWVYCQLNKFDYEEYVTKRREQAIREGFDYWYKGQVALMEGNLVSAIEMFMQGLEAVKPVANEELTCVYKDQTMDVGRELYASLKDVFNGITITTDKKALEGKAFQGINEPVTVKVMRSSVPLKNLSLKYAFAIGDGQLSDNNLTDENGEVQFYVKNITSKVAQQEIKISLDEKIFGRLKGSGYKGLMEDMVNKSPKAVVNVNIGQTQLNAYVVPASDADESVRRAVERVLTANYFNVVSTTAQADVLVKISTQFRKGETVAGDMRDMIIYYAGAQVKLTNNRTGAGVADYGVSDLKVMQPSSASQTAARAAAVREILKRLEKGLATELKNLNISTDGERNASPVVAEEPKVVVPQKPQVDPKKEPQIIIIERPVVKPVVAPVEKPVEKPTAKVIEGELFPGFFVRFVGMKHLSDRTILTFSLINKTGDEKELYFSTNTVKIMNESGEQVAILNMKIGKSGYSTWVKGLVVADVPTAFVLEVKPVNKVTLAQIEDDQRHVVKLRNMQ